MKRFKAVECKFDEEEDRAVLEKLFELRAYRKETDFSDFMQKYIRQRKKSFKTQDKYSRHFDLNEIRCVVEGGVYDGQDTFRFLEALKKYDSFQRVYAFEPFLTPFREVEYFTKIDPVKCEFHQQALWDRNGQIAFHEHERSQRRY